MTHLRIGEEDHRARLPLEIYPYSAGIKGGIAGGFVMAALATFQGIVLHGSPWYTINLLAATGMASLATASAAYLAAFHLDAFLVALLIHAVVSLIVGLLYGVLLPMLPRYPMSECRDCRPSAVDRAAVVNFKCDRPSAEYPDRMGMVYHVPDRRSGLPRDSSSARSEKIRTLQHLSFAVRSGVEALWYEIRGALSDQAPLRFNHRCSSDGAHARVRLACPDGRLRPRGPKIRRRSPISSNFTAKTARAVTARAGDSAPRCH